MRIGFYDWMKKKLKQRKRNKQYEFVLEETDDTPHGSYNYNCDIISIKLGNIYEDKTKLIHEKAEDADQELIEDYIGDYISDVIAHEHIHKAIGSPEDWVKGKKVDKSNKSKENIIAEVFFGLELVCSMLHKWAGTSVMEYSDELDRDKKFYRIKG